MLFLAGLRQPSRRWCVGLLGLSRPALPEETHGAAGELAGFAWSHGIQPAAQGLLWPAWSKQKAKAEICCLRLFRLGPATQRGKKRCYLRFPPGILRTLFYCDTSVALRNILLFWDDMSIYICLMLGNSLLSRPLLSGQGTAVHRHTIALQET